MQWSVEMRIHRWVTVPGSKDSLSIWQDTGRKTNLDIAVRKQISVAPLGLHQYFPCLWHALWLAETFLCADGYTDLNPGNEDMLYSFPSGAEERLSHHVPLPVEFSILFACQSAAHIVLFHRSPFAFQAAKLRPRVNMACQRSLPEVSAKQTLALIAHCSTKRVLHSLGCFSLPMDLARINWDWQIPVGKTFLMAVLCLQFKMNGQSTTG